MYRVWQVGQALGAWLKPGREEEAAAVRSLQTGAPAALPAAAVSLFRAMPRHDRRHALRVMHSLQVQGWSQPELLAAALLHDVGKSGWRSVSGASFDQGLAPGEGESLGRVRLWHRAAAVLMRAAWPGLLERIGRDGRPHSWRAPFYAQLHHAAIGARLTERAGCSPVTVALIRHHQGPPAGAGDEWLAALRAADDKN